MERHEIALQPGDGETDAGEKEGKDEEQKGRVVAARCKERFMAFLQ